MNAIKRVVAMAVSGVASGSDPACGIAQQVAGELGSSSATMILDNKQLPPDPKFGGVIAEEILESKAQ